MKTFVLSNGESQNSRGFKINIEGISLDRFRGNPVMLYNHDRERVIGRWENIRIENNCLLADADIDLEDELGKEISRKVEKGYLKGCSLGIYIKKMVDTEDGAIATETELLEASIVAVPSDAGAVTLYDENNEPTSIEAVRLSFNFKNNNMDKKFELTAATFAALSLDSDANADAVEKAVKSQNQRITELEAKISEMGKAKVMELINRAVADKKIGAEVKAQYVALAEKDYEGVSAILAAMPAVQPVKAQLNAKGASSKFDGKTWDELDKAGMLASLKAEAPEQYQVLYKEKFKIN